IRKASPDFQAGSIFYAYDRRRRVLELKVKHVHHQKILPVYKDNVSADHSVYVTHWRWGQIGFNFHRAWMHTGPQPGRQRAPDHDLTFQPRRQAVALGQSGWQMIMMARVPSVQLAIVLAVVMAFRFRLAPFSFGLVPLVLRNFLLFMEASMTVSVVMIMIVISVRIW